MNIQPKTEPGLPPDFLPTNPNNTFEPKTIPELVKVLRGTCRFDTFDIVEGVLVSRDMRLREENQQLQYKFQMEVLSRIQAEEDYRKREELCVKGKRVQESYEDLLKEVKANGLAHTDTIEKLRKKNDELDCEVKKLKEKCVDDGNKFDVIRRENEELGCEVLELRKMKEKWVADSNELCVLKEMIGKLEQEVLELKKSKKKWLDDSNVLDELRVKVSQLELENRELADKKRGKDGRGASSARGRGLPENAEVIDLDDEDDNDNLPISQGIHRKKAIFEVEVMNEYPSSSEATQQKSKFANAVNTVKRKFPFTVIETSSSSSSAD